MRTIAYRYQDLLTGILPELLDKYLVCKKDDDTGEITGWALRDGKDFEKQNVSI